MQIQYKDSCSKGIDKTKHTHVYWVYNCSHERALKMFKNDVAQGSEGWFKAGPRIITKEDIARLRHRYVVPDDPDECWNWKVCKAGKYPTFSIGAFYLKASRVMYMLAYGHYPGDMFVLHMCNNPRCVNPKHLYLGTQKENAEDRTVDRIHETATKLRRIWED